MSMQQQFPSWGRFETRRQPLLSWRRFGLRLLAFFGTALLLDALAVVIGAVGFHYFERLGWLDALLNGAMIITGNGPEYRMHSPAGKVFQMLYALIGGIVFVMVVSVLLAPVFHRVLHAFSVEFPDDEPE
ncbi:MAG TPA: hypothetical protein PLO69_14340 [Gammaproteobacteria bacterium]|nr:hypothetical protein [Gammaproteobacteria bacterium]